MPQSSDGTLGKCLQTPNRYLRMKIIYNHNISKLFEKAFFYFSLQYLYKIYI